MRNKILKFRAWDGLNKKFTYWTMNDLCTYSEKDEKLSALDDWQQDTRLLDRNGKDIYEGDIVRDPAGSISSVQFNSETAMFGEKHPTFDFWRQIGLDVEVIGNIWENPELLKV